MELKECRVCKGQKTQIHSVTSSLPAFMWPLPKNKKNLFLDAGLFICDDCSHVQLQSFSENFIHSLYKDEYFVLENASRDLGRVDLLISSFGRKMLNDSKFLDIGGGNNPLADSLETKEIRCENWVVDINPKALASEKAKHVVTGRFEDAPLPNGYFDFATSFFSMEHFNYPSAVAKRMSEVLRPGGLAIIEVPNLSGLIDYVPYYLVFHQHVSIFSIGSLNSLFSLHGFKNHKVLHEKESIIVVYENIHDTKKLSAPTIDPKLELDRFRERMQEIEKNLKKLNIPPDSNDFGLYGAGGGASLFLANYPWMKKGLSKVFDRDERKHNRSIPGTELAILPPSKIESSGIKKLLFLSTIIYKNVAPKLSVDCINFEPKIVKDEILIN